MTQRAANLIAVGDIQIQRTRPLDIFGDTREILSEADLLVGNQESPACDRGTPLQGKREVGSSHARASIDSIPALAEVGFRGLTLANNHMMDYGPDGLSQTLELLAENDIVGVGAGNSLESARTARTMEAYGTTVAMLGFTSVFPRFGFAAGPEQPGVATLRVSTSYETPVNVPYQPGTPPTTVTIPDTDDLEWLTGEIEAARRSADLVVVQAHWGVVGLPQVLGYMKEVARSAVDAGADLVIGNHSHVIQGIELYRGIPILYGLNHFAFEHGTHRFPEWPSVHDSLILRSEIRDGKFAAHSLAVASLDPDSHTLSMATRQRRAAVARHLNSLSEEFGTTISDVGDYLTFSGPVAGTPAPLRAPAVLSDPAPIVLEGWKSRPRPQ